MMAADDPDEHDESPFRTPPDPTERTWLHPSELGKLLPSLAHRPHTPEERAARSDRVRPLAVPLIAGMVGAALMLGVVALTGNLRKPVNRQVTTQVFGGGASASDDPDGASAVVSMVAPAILGVRVASPTGPRTGSALAYRSDGRLVTSHDLVADASSIDVRSATGWSRAATLVGTDPETGIAVLSIEASPLTLATLGKTSEMRPGQNAVAVGAPTSPGISPTVSAGIIAALGQEYEHDNRGYFDMIATSALAWPVQAGGALVNREGAVVGLAMVTDSRVMAVPIDTVRRVADEIITKGHATHTWLGLSAADLDPATAHEYGATIGALVREVAPGSPAAKAGVEVQDVVTTLGADKVGSMAELLTLLRRYQPGDTVPLKVIHAGKVRTVKVVLADRPAG
jgi:S1-C subfamily serine protease